MESFGNGWDVPFSRRSGNSSPDLYTLFTHTLNSVPATTKTTFPLFLIKPRSPFKLVWDSVNVLFLMYSLVEIFYSMSFTQETCKWTDSVKIGFVVDCFFMIDCLLNFFTAYENTETNELVVDRIKICKKYVFGWFTLDAVSSIPFHLISCAVDSSSVNQNKFRLLRAFRLLKAARIVDMMQTVAGLEAELGHFLHNSIRFLTFFYLIGLFIHACACLWYSSIYWANCRIPTSYDVTGFAPCGCDAASPEDCRAWNWMIKYAGGTQAQYDQLLANRSHYTLSLYYSIVTLTTLGYGDVTPSNNVEYVVASGLALGGALMFSVLIGSVGALILERNSVETSISESTARLVDLCRLTRAPRTLEKRVRKQATLTAAGAPQAFADVAQLPRAMQVRLLAGVADPLLKKLPLFRGLGADYRARLAQILRPCSFRAGEAVFHAGDIAADMYWVVSGSVSLLRDERGGRSPAPGKGRLRRSLESILRALPSGRSGSAGAAARAAAVQREGATSPRADGLGENGGGGVGGGASGGGDGGEPVVVETVAAGGVFGEVELLADDVLADPALAARLGFPPAESADRPGALRYAVFRARSARAEGQCELLELRWEDLEGPVRARMPDLYDALLRGAQARAHGLAGEWPRRAEDMRARFSGLGPLSPPPPPPQPPPPPPPPRSGGSKGRRRGGRRAAGGWGAPGVLDESKSMAGSKDDARPSWLPPTPKAIERPLPGWLGSGAAEPQLMGGLLVFAGAGASVRRNPALESEQGSTLARFATGPAFELQRERECSRREQWEVGEPEEKGLDWEEPHRLAVKAWQGGAEECKEDKVLGKEEEEALPLAVSLWPAPFSGTAHAQPRTELEPGSPTLDSGLEWGCTATPAGAVGIKGAAKDSRGSGGGWEQAVDLMRQDVQALQGEVLAVSVQLGEMRSQLAQVLMALGRGCERGGVVSGSGEQGKCG